MRFKTIYSGISIALRTLTLLSIVAGTATTALAKDPLITRASYESRAASNAPAVLLIHGSFPVGQTPVVTLGDISTATTSGNPASPDLVVASFSTTDIAVTVSHPLDSGLVPGTYRLDVRTFDAAERESHTAHFYLALSASDLGVGFVLDGRIAAIAPPALTVGGKTVTTDAKTKFGGTGNPTSLADLSVGDQVQVTGQLQADGSVLASSIVRQ